MTLSRRAVTVTLSAVALAAVAVATPAGASAAALPSTAGAGHIAAPRSGPALQLPAPSSTAGGLLSPAAPTFQGSWSFVGPRPIANENPTNPSGNYGNASGRITSIAVDPAVAGTAYAASAGGGVWKTTDGGANWSPTSDSQYTGAIGAVATGPGANPGDPTVVYAGTGENNLCFDCQIGFGVLKSTDGGATWTLLAQATFTGLAIGGIAVDQSTNGGSQRILAGTSNGLYISTNGGATWTASANFAAAITKVTGGLPTVFDVRQDPTTVARFYATVGDNCNRDYGDVLVSNDAGGTWASTLTGKTATTKGCSARPSVGVGTGGVAYATLPNPTAGLDSVWKSTDGGGTWNKLANQPPDFFTSGAGSQGWYDNVTAVDPTSNNRVVFGGIDLVATSDGGTSYTTIGKVYSGGSVHPDQHAVAFTAASSFYLGNDGGIWTTTNMGGTGTAGDWTNRNATLATVQFYSGAALDATHLLGGAQDNGNPGSFAGTGGNPVLPAFQEYEGGDGFYTAIDPGSNTIYTEYPSGFIVKGSRTSQFTNSAAAPCNVNSDPACGEPSLFSAPFVVDPNSISNMFAGTNRVYRSTTGGQPAGAGGWTPISGNVTTATPPANNTNCFASDCIASMATAAGGNVVMTGSFFGAVYLSTNAQAGSPTFTNITGNLPAFSGAHSTGSPWISGVAFNTANTSEAWVSVASDTTIGRIWHTVNAGAGGGTTWTNITANYPQFTATSILADPANPGTIYVGGLQGVSVCAACGGGSPTPSWSAAGSGLPNSEVDGLTVSADGTLLLAWTHGRGVWSLPKSPGNPVPEWPAVPLGLLTGIALLVLRARSLQVRRSRLG